MSPGETKTYPLASDRSERFKRSLVCTSPPLCSLRPPRGMARLGAPGWAGENSSLFEHPARLVMLPWTSMAMGGRRQNAFPRNLLVAAIRALRRLFFRFSLFEGQRKENLAGTAGPDFKIGDPLVVDLGREQEFDRVVAQQSTVAELDKGDPVVEDFEGCFLPFAIQQMAKHHDRLAFALDAEIFQRMLGRSGARILTGRACSC